jgi:hypothetical protein
MGYGQRADWRLSQWIEEMDALLDLLRGHDAGLAELQSGDD